MFLKKEKLSTESFVFYQLLGKGSFGEVYLVRKKGDSKEYAMKILDKELVINKNLMKYVNAERNVLSVLDHPFMVKLYFAFQSTEKLFLVMAFCPGFF